MFVECGSTQPAIFLREGTTKRWNVTRAETGFPDVRSTMEQIISYLTSCMVGWNEQLDNTTSPGKANTSFVSPRLSTVENVVGFLIVYRN